jgi:S-adenosylmethionine:tRNA ribosyltransferase-isomerase
MHLKDFDYDLPKNLIAQTPSNPRDHSRLLVLDKKTAALEHKYFFNIVDYLNPGDVLVLNNTKVFPARLMGRKKETGGKIEVFLLRENKKQKTWQCLLGGGGRKENLEITFDKNLQGEILKNNNNGTWEIKFNRVGKSLMAVIEKIGRMPLPPYIKTKDDKSALRKAKERYQTVYAEENKIGSVAAPTAGLHFSKVLLKKIKAKKIEIEYVTLHVGLGTFAPIKAEDITKHKMHAEWAEMDKKVLAKILKAKQEKRRVIAVGTTSARVLETVFNKLNSSTTKNNFSGWTNIFIYPGYKFKAVDALITNFHLPNSTLIILVSALAGRDKIFKAYQEAIKKQYRFYSYGDAMLIS